jgi:hypothetical protein
MKQALFIFLALCMSLTGCSSSAPPTSKQLQELAKCMQAKTTADEVFELGVSVDMTASGYPIHIRRRDYLGCRGAKGIFEDAKTREAQGRALSALYLPDRTFRAGIQTAAWRSAGRPPAEARALAELVLDAGENTILRAWGRSCNVLSEDMASVLRDMEAPYLAAYVGTRGWVQSPAEAQTLASTIAEQAKSHALFQAEAVATECKDARMRSKLDAHMTAMRTFGLGTNPLVPGCRATPQGAELVLSCQASDK